MKKPVLVVASMLALMAFNSCKKEDQPTSENPKGGKGNILLTTVLSSPDGMTGASYMQLIADKNGTQSINNDNTFPIPYGGSYPLAIGKDIFVFPSYMGDTANELKKYSYQNQQLVEGVALELPPKSSANNVLKLSDSKAYLSMAGLGKILIFNPSTMKKTGEIDITSYGYKDKNPDPSIMIERDGKVFLGLSQMVGGWTSAPEFTQSDMLVINPQTDQVEKKISETNSGFSMPTRPIDPNSIFVDEDGDIYVSCIGDFGMVPGHKAGVLRIKKGETDFDPTYHWTITGASIEGETKAAGYISSIYYVGGGKAFGYVNIPGYYKKGDIGHSAIADRAVIYDLKAQTMKVIDGLDLSNGYGVLISKYKDGKLAISNASATKKGIYKLDTQTNKVESSPFIQTQGNPMSFHYFN